MSWFMVDVEADGPAPGLFSMVSIGAVLVKPGLQTTFYGRLRPISDNYVQSALDVCKHIREETLTFPDPAETMQDFSDWIYKVNSDYRPMFISDNNGFDFAFVNYYFHRFLGRNPFGWSSANLNSIYKGMEKNIFANYKNLRKTKHTHHPVDDAMGCAEAILAMQEMGFGIKL
jgi:hypothetical protein